MGLKVNRGRHNKSLKAQAAMMEHILGHVNDVDYYAREAQNERNMADESIPFCFDAEQGIYHLKRCTEIEDGEKTRYKACKTIPNNGNICPKCYRKACIMQGMEDGKGMIFTYMNFFAEHSIPTIYIKRLSVERQAKFKILSPDSMQITLKSGDTFKIEHSNPDQAFIIFHNNYVQQDSNRYFTPGEHLEDGGYLTIKDAIDKVLRYSHWDTVKGRANESKQ